MLKTTLIYGITLAAIAFSLQWLQYLHNVRLFATEIYIVLIAILFTALGLWVGNRLTSKTESPLFERNVRAIEALRVSKREYQVLELIAAGHSNQEIANKLFVSLNTVKTHVSHLYDKLGVSRRTQAVDKARDLRLIP